MQIVLTLHVMTTCYYSLTVFSRITHQKKHEWSEADFGLGGVGAAGAQVGHSQRPAGITLSPTQNVW